MNTSYYSKNSNHPNAVAISAKVPEFYTGKHVKILAPSWSIFKEYKDDESNPIAISRYTERFYNEILSKLNPIEIFNLLGENAVLLCYEAPGKFCHRHLVAEWLMRNLNIKIVEL